MLSRKLLLSGVAAAAVLASGVLFAASLTRVKGESHPVPARASLSGPRPQSPNDADRQELDNDLLYLDGYVRRGDLDEFVKAADQVKEKWSLRDQEYYGRLMLNISNMLANYFDAGRAWQLSQKYASDALARADRFSPYLETDILRFLSLDLAPRLATGDVASEWAKERGAKAKLWLHALRRMEQGTDVNFDFNDLPYLNVMPPEETGLPAGVAPEGIKDPRLRAQYEAAIKANTEKSRKYNQQFEMRHLNQFFAPKAEEYLIKAYSKPPFALEELKKLLDANLKSKGRKEKILNGVKKKMAEGDAPLTSGS